jgi:hypothetical protein
MIDQMFLTTNTSCWEMELCGDIWFMEMVGGYSA